MQEKINILIIDDDEFDRQLIIRALKPSGFKAEVTIATGISDANKILAGASFDCIFLDYNLPGSNGLEILKEIKNLKGICPIIMVTNQGDESLAVKAMKLGASDYISKTLISTESVSQLIRYALKIKSAQATTEKIEKKLVEAENRLEKIIANIPIALFSVDKCGMIKYFRGKGKEFLLQFGIEVENKSIYDLDSRLPSQTHLFSKAIAGNCVDDDFVFDDKFYKIVYMPSVDESGNVSSVDGIIFDNTVAKTSEHELKKSLEESEENQKIKETFLANMSHEIRTPIHGIMNLSDILLKTTLNPEQYKFLTAIKRSADNLLVIINDILDLSKIEAQKMTFENTPFCTREVINVIYDLFKPKADENGIALKLEFDSNIPELLNGDQVRFSQVINNLVNNAIKFTEKGEVKITAKACEFNESFCVLEIAVEDTGMGIPQHKLQSIFNSFTQASDDITRKFGGTGLGLSICKKLVEMQGGIIDVKSKLGKGSVFSFKLPFELCTEALHKEEEKEKKNFDGAPLHILVVEDNDINRLVIRKMIKDWGFSCDEATDGIKALELISEKKYDVVLMDVEMPGKNGYEATKEIRKNTDERIKNIAIIAMTAHANSAEKDKCLLSGMNDYVSKPFNADDLKHKILTLLSRSAINSGGSEKSVSPRITNLAYLREISDNNEDFFKDFINLFLQNAPLSITDLETGAANKDWEKVRQASHKLKPSLSYIGMKEMHAMAASIEDYSKSKSNLSEIPLMIRQLKSACDQAYEELENELKSLSV